MPYLLLRVDYSTRSPSFFTQNYKNSCFLMGILKEINKFNHPMVDNIGK
jgi:hypothetical protein